MTVSVVPTRRVQASLTSDDQARSLRRAQSTLRDARRVGPYAIGVEIGRGMTSIVSAARHLGLGRRVAFKELRPQGMNDPTARNLFREEARIVGSLTHANVVAVHDFVDQEGVSAIVMECASRGSVRSHMRRGGLRIAQAGGVLEGLLAGLSHVEGRGIVHLDIKPQNLLVTGEGAIKLADFGIAQWLDPQDAGTLIATARATAGTPHYVAPEQVMAGRLGTWTDLYAVGITAFELFVGRSPFADARDPVDIVMRQIHERVPRMCDVVPSVSPEISDWVDWLVSKVPGDRPQTAVEAWPPLESALIKHCGRHWRDEAAI